MDGSPIAAIAPSMATSACQNPEPERRIDLLTCSLRELCTHTIVDTPRPTCWIELWGADTPAARALSSVGLRQPVLQWLITLSGRFGKL